MNNLREKGDENFKVLAKYTPADKRHLLLRKGVFPYAWFDNLDKLNATELPPREAFTNDLTGEECSEEDYQHAQTVWRVFGMYKCNWFREDFNFWYPISEISYLLL